jgi:hypothetical protein
MICNILEYWTVLRLLSGLMKPGAGISPGVDPRVQHSAILPTVGVRPGGVIAHTALDEVWTDRVQPWEPRATPPWTVDGI